MRVFIKKVFIIRSVLINRINASNKIAALWRCIAFRDRIRPLKNDKEDNYLLCLHKDNCSQVLFTAEHDNGLQQTFFFDFNAVLQCFTLFIPKNSLQKYFKGVFYADGNSFVSQEYPVIEQSVQKLNVIDLNEVALTEERLSDVKEDVISDFYKMLFKRKVNVFGMKKSLSLKYNNKLSLASNVDLKRSPSMNTIFQSNIKSILKPCNSHRTIVKRKISFGIVEYSY